MSGRMFCYLWEDLRDNGKKCKFGERFVFDGQDPEKECRARVRQSLSVNKSLLDNGTVRLHRIWDVSKVAEKVGKNKPHGDADNYLRKHIGHFEKRTEIHNLNVKDMEFRVNKLLAKLGGETVLVDAALSTKQTQTAIETIEAFNEGARIILANLCARFGKTIWSAAVAVEMEAQLIVVGSYVKTVFASFASDLVKFSQFAGFEHIDMQDHEYQSKISIALAEGKKVFAYLSMCNGSRRQERIDYIASVDAKKMLILDEADFGVHQKTQAQPLVDISHNIDYILIMTGTNADRAVTHWDIDHILSVTYPELLMQKRETQNA